MGTDVQHPVPVLQRAILCRRDPCSFSPVLARWIETRSRRQRDSRPVRVRHRPDPYAARTGRNRRTQCAKRAPGERVRRGVFRARSAFVCRSEHSHRAVHRDDRQPWLLQGRLETAGSHPGGHRQTTLAVVRRPHRPDRARRPGITVSRQGSRTRRGLGPLGVGEHRVSSTRQYRRRGSPSGGRSTLTPGATTCRNAPAGALPLIQADRVPRLRHHGRTRRLPRR